MASCTLRPDSEPVAGVEGVFLLDLRSVLLHLLTLLLLHEFAEIHALTRPIKSSLASSTALDWLVDSLIIETTTESLRSESIGSSKTRAIDSRAGAEWHHKALKMSLS